MLKVDELSGTVARFGRRVHVGVKKSDPNVMPVPPMIASQKLAFEKFVRLGKSHDDVGSSGNDLQAVFESVFPITSQNGLAQLCFCGYALEPHVYDELECIDRNITYSAKLRVRLQLVVWTVATQDSPEPTVKSIKEQSVYMCALPMMTDRGTFVINGVEHVIVSQMHRSPGVFFDNDGGKTHGSGKILYAAHIIPYRGSWLDIEFDVRDLIQFRVDKKRKMCVTTLLMACGMTKLEILTAFYKSYQCIWHSGDVWRLDFDPVLFSGVRLPFVVLDESGEKTLVEMNTKMTPRLIKSLQDSGTTHFYIKSASIVGQYSSKDLLAPGVAEPFIVAGDQITSEHTSRIIALGIHSINLLLIDQYAYSSYMRDTLAADRNNNGDEAMIEIYRVSRPGETISSELVKNSFKGLFFNSTRYDLSDVGRVKINKRLGLDLPEETSVLTVQDILRTIEELIRVKDGHSEIDDIDHLGSRRVRPLNELVENQFRIGLVRMARASLERMAIVDIDSVMPHDLVNPKLVSSVIKDFFATSQLSQFMDQTNPLSEITHKRRLSALGPGGLNRERAGFNVRDVHATHYCRICPVETSEGANIGLITSLAIYATVNKYGFIETPYRKVLNGIVTNDVDYLTAGDETKNNIAQADAKLDRDGKLLGDWVICRRASDIIMVAPAEVNYMDVSTKQIVSVAASLIPFLENNDANRALMGSNMQRQAVPLLCPKAPIVGTGMEERVARDSRAVVVAKNAGVVRFVDGIKIIICSDDGAVNVEDIKIDVYTLLKWRRTNFNTCINQRPLVSKGEFVKEGQVIAGGFATEGSELALGSNALVAFMPWRGDNFEDSIVISERVVYSDMFTSVHIEEFECVARDTRLGSEEITRDIPSVSEESLSQIDESGVIRIGAQVKTGDILVGKITPKGESPMTPEEKLLRAVFCENAVDFRDSSLYVPSGVNGTVMDVKILSRKGVERDERALAIDKMLLDTLRVEMSEKANIIRQFVANGVRKLLLGSVLKSGPAKLGIAGSVITSAAIASCTDNDVLHALTTDQATNEKIALYVNKLEEAKKSLEHGLQLKINTLFDGVELQHGVLKIVKVLIATTHKLQPGDKMAGRHGNKGVISRIVPVEDMPYMEDGRPVDIVLNPLGIPSRMNSGQIMETYLGFISMITTKRLLDIARESLDGWQLHAKKLLKGFFTDDKDVAIIDEATDDVLREIISVVESSGGLKVSCPVFEGADDKTVSDLLEAVGLDRSGQSYLYDGFTGKKFDRKITVGYLYMLKLHHMVDNKIHARSTGPYSLVTQQPLGGKAYFGGQRLGEMECWALEAYGAAYTLRESLTIKSDDVHGRVMAYESIVRGESDFVCGIPESFNVMVRELSALCLRVECFSLADVEGAQTVAAEKKD